VDVVAAHGYKWLMASYGVAPVHFSERAIEAIHPVYVGRLSVQSGFEDLEYTLHWQPGAKRYQTGGINWLGIAALNASCSLIRAADLTEIERHTLRLTDRVLAGAEERGYTVTSCPDRPRRSQIASFTAGDRDTDADLVQRLAERKVAVTLRGRGIRVSPYFYNSDDDVDRLIESLPRR
jgi:selenocysteine lyase/cysteine desulfurase